jgi:carboxylesterase type B
MALMQLSFPEPQDNSSELHSLNLNITVPKIDGKLSLNSNLPVFVWIHGGGFVSGASSWPQYDMTRLVNLSVDRNTPIIGVSIK